MPLTSTNCWPIRASSIEQPCEHRQVPQSDRSVEPVKPVDFPVTTVALGRVQGVFHLNQHRALLQHSVGQHAHIGQVQGHGQRDRHRQQPIGRDTRSAFRNSAPAAIPLHLVASTGDLIEPNFSPVGIQT